MFLELHYRLHAWLKLGGWLAIGIAIGIRIFGMFTILPQYLLNYHGYLPAWYGLVIIAYSGAVILSQVFAISSKKSFSLETPLLALLASIGVLAIPDLFSAQYSWGAVLWVLALALEEVFAPYIDVHASQSQSLLAKEVGVSIGGGICVLLSRSFASPLLISLIGMALIILGFALLSWKFGAVLFKR